MFKPENAIDFYKSGHVFQYPKGSTLVYSNWTARSAHLSNIPAHLFDGHVTNFGLQYFVKNFLINAFKAAFFDQPKADVLARYKRRMDNALGTGVVSVDHIGALHDLGFLPVEIRALPEGAAVPIKVPLLVIWNTLPAFYWLTNYLESVMSTYLHKMVTTATTARHYRKLMTYWATRTGAPAEFIQFQCHDFSFRGMSGPQDAAMCGAAHLTSFVGTDTVPSIDLLEEFYGADSDKELVGASVPATEHSVMCMGSKETEIETFQRLICEVYPDGIVSIVSDTWDFWKVITQYAAELKTDILERAGKVVFRPDSGDPVKIIVGDPDAPDGSPAHKGAVRCLWEIYGGTTTSEGFKVLDEHVGLIYGDSITLQRAEAILEGLAAHGFASNNIVFGVGSYTYSYVTRDTYGFAVKSTYGEINGEGVDIYKDPVTDDGVKKSARGRVMVALNDAGEYELHDQMPAFDNEGDQFVPIFRNGKLLVDHSLAEIRARVAAS